MLPEGTILITFVVELETSHLRAAKLLVFRRERFLNETLIDLE